MPEALQTAREGTQEPLMLSIGALPSERAALNSQGRGLKHLELVTPVAVSKGGSLAAPLPQTARGGDPRTPRGLLADPFLGACAPHLAPRARVPLFSLPAAPAMSAGRCLARGSEQRIATAQDQVASQPQRGLPQ